jgi:hypothetical protein
VVAVVREMVDLGSPCRRVVVSGWSSDRPSRGSIINCLERSYPGTVEALGHGFYWRFPLLLLLISHCALPELICLSEQMVYDISSNSYLV